MCGYESPDKPIPRIEALVYRGKNLFEEKSEDKDDEYIFQRPQNYFINDITSEDMKKQIMTESKGSGDVIVPQDCIHLLKDYEELLQWLKELRQSKGADALY